MDSDDEICPKSCRMYCRNRWNFGRPKFCDAKRIEDALDGLHGDELFNMAIQLMWEKSSYVREGQYDYVLAVQRAIITEKLEGKLLHHTLYSTVVEYDVRYTMLRYIIICSAELEPVNETIEKDDEEIKSLETLKEIVQWPEMYPLKEYTVACLVQQFTNSRLLFLLNKRSRRLRKVDFEKLIDKLNSADNLELLTLIHENL